MKKRKIDYCAQLGGKNKVDGSLQDVFIMHCEVYRYNCHQVLPVLDLSQQTEPRVILQISSALFSVKKNGNELS